MHTWFGDLDTDDAPTWRQLAEDCVDGVMASHPVHLERTLKSHRAPRACAAK